MKVCPFCREEVREEAIKCRYCSSSLLPADSAPQDPDPTPPAARPQSVYLLDKDLIRFVKFTSVVLATFIAIGLLLYGYEIRQTARHLPPSTPQTSTAIPAVRPDQVVYVLDQDLVRFAKFAAAVLAVFVTFGLFFYGFDLKQAAKEVRESADKVSGIRYDVGKARDEVAADQKEAKRLLTEAQTSLASLKKQIQTAQENTQRMAAEVDANRLQVQSFLAEAQQGVSSISDTQKQAAAFYTRLITGPSQAEPSPAAAAATSKPNFSVTELARLYDFPTELDGRGQCIGLIELGGGYNESDLATYFSKLGIPQPKVTSVSIGGAKNDPGGEHGGVGAKVTLDVEVAGAAAPGAHIVVYFSPNTDKGFLTAIKRAIKDRQNRPSVLAISWGGPESTWTRESIMQMDQAFQAAAELGITVICAAGDAGVTDSMSAIYDGDGKGPRPRVDFPASSPWVLACGGTRLTASAQQISSEVVWNDGQSGATGGGVSEIFSMPVWQSHVNVPARRDGSAGRGIPDVSAHASPTRGYQIYHDGLEMVLGGTAATTPLWAGLIARINQGLGRRVGYINPLLYSTLGPAEVLRGITEGDNSMNDVKGFPAGSGWNASAGWGSPNGAKLLKALREHMDLLPAQRA